MEMAADKIFSASSESKDLQTLLDALKKRNMDPFTAAEKLVKDLQSNIQLKISSSSSKTEKKSYQGALKLEVPKVEEFYLLTEDGKESTQFCVENEYEDDDANDAYEIVNPTRPRPR